MLRLLSCVASSLFATASFAQTTVAFPAGEKTVGNGAKAVPGQASSCSFVGADLPKDTIVIAAGSYSGRQLDFQIDQSGHEATQFDVAVHSDKPVALLLGAYEPTIWSIGWSKGTRVVAVFATGYHRQVVAGLPKGTPVITSSYEEKSPCGYNYIGSEQGLAWVNPKARSVFGTEAARVYNQAPGGLLDIVESTRSKTAYVTSPDTPPQSFRDTAAPKAGTAGLEDAVAKGLLRPITTADLDMVREHYRAMASKTPTGKPDIPPVAGASSSSPPEVRIPSIWMHRGYVVQKPFVYPAGLYGANSASFVVPKGVASPTGNPGHSTVIDLNRSNPCVSAMCR
ncbi:hypothetical protein OOT46_21755 [Aquabacterium sp. A7-Y]|uniref:hypothetical protein n=1 Tax=Aquabacterium sp. A7-Y TaxID=1349605 RepID=UPI00223D5B3A|nr:hypothetical protein [Aquabacterium sp. A7-Y]MCW7540456.1 hypothetical protein [Aquabacterium sp. A7-Y]